MKKEYLVIALLGVVAFGTLAYTAPRKEFQVTKVFQNYGDTRQGFTVAVTSSAWVEILPLGATRRYAVIQATSTSITEVCFSTISALATTCVASTSGRHMPQIGITIEDYNEAPLYARGVAASAAISPTSISIVGERQSDSGD